MIRWVRDRAGQSIIELALSLSILVFGLVGGADFARAQAAQMAVINAARAGAEAGVTGTAASDAAIITYAQDEFTRIPGLGGQQATITVAHSTVGSVNYTTVRVRFVFTTLVAWPIVPNSIALDRSAQWRNYP